MLFRSSRRWEQFRRLLRIFSIGTHMSVRTAGKCDELFRDFVNKNDLQNLLSPTEQQEILRIFDILNFNPQTKLIVKGESASWTGFLLTGEIKVLRHGVQRHLYKTGATVGEMHFFAGVLFIAR